MEYGIHHWVWYCWSCLDVAEKAEGSLMLHSINELREHQPAQSPGGGAIAMATTPIYHTLVLLHTVLGEHNKVDYCIGISKPTRAE